MRASSAKCLLLLTTVGAKSIAALSKIYNIYSQCLIVLSRNTSRRLREGVQERRSRSTFIIWKRKFKQQIYSNGSRKLRQKYHNHKSRKISIRPTPLLSSRISIKSTNWRLSRQSPLRLQTAKERESISTGSKGWLETIVICGN